VSIGRYIPILEWLQTYRAEWLRFDVIAGVTTAAVVIPQAMAMATVAHLPVEFGLYTVLLPMLIYVLLGTSRRMSMSTTSTIAILTGSALTETVHASSPRQALVATATLALLVGVALLLASILRLGSIANFISDPVLLGFKIGLGVVIIADQAPKLLGIHVTKVGFFRDLASFFQHLPETSGITLIVGVGTLALIFVIERFWPHGPGPLLALGTGITASWLAGLAQHGVAVVGNMPAGLPGFALPEPTMFEQLWPVAIGIALMSFTETVAVGRAFAGPGEPRPDADRELRALGVANLIGGMFHSMPAGGGTSQTAVNSRAGARTQVAGFVTVVVGFLAVLFLAPVIRLMPHATLAAAVVATAVGLLSTRELAAVWSIRRMEFWWGAIAAMGVVLLGALHGILVAVIVSLAALVYETNCAPVYVLGRKPGTNIFRARSADHPEDESFPGLLLVRTEGRMYFANAQSVGDRIWPLIHTEKPRVLALDCSAIPDIEYTALKMLTNAEARLREEGIDLWLAGLTPVALGLIRRAPLGPLLGRDRMCHDVAQAVSRFQELERNSAATHEHAQPR
jgi:high affinity sulfate transporter 1